MRPRAKNDRRIVRRDCDPAPYDEAYPTLAEPVATFIGRYLASRETVLILQGPPGTGKTRLVRAILAAMWGQRRGVFWGVRH
jgi:MoxR-like ATPase